MEGVQENIGEGIFQCTNHPYKNNTTPGGICPFCLQEKLGNLVSSSAVFPSYSSSSSTSSFKSDFGNTSITSSSLSLQTNIKNTTNFTKSRKSEGENFVHQKKGLWSFLYNSSSKHFSTVKKSENPTKDINFPSSSALSGGSIVVEENEISPIQVYSRSRSIGCGSRNVSGDCILRRVESQREGKHRVSSRKECIKERVRCRGIFSGFMITNSSSSYWGWVLASPMRAFSKPLSSKKREASNKNATPNLAAIPSLLTN
ncbi:uncharacterized protein LOC107770263 [Nicotiana tabacum]|uniref:Uncharacterized protein LOC107770263 n=2 Tax=Nicotiana TaxID=4085 RepID=A0A1S3XYX1_TOBAC|nr:PREDICTED: uncharacterized protein LOC104231340 [Nicotiana sylvestris]XP_016445039.1 PREDICTED: uncharacterized protein LOC107770263 [Nicotiana tabacum]